LGAHEGATLELGPHHKRLEVVTEWRQADGTTTRQSDALIELATGMHYLADGQWRPTQERIEILPEGAVARHGPHRVIWPLELTPQQEIDLVSADEQRFRSRVLGLSYFDAGSGKSVLFAEVQPAQAELVGPNKLAYRDAFTEVRADLVYEYRRDRFAQDVVIRAPLPGPEQFGLDPGTTRLELVTEFLEAPDPVKEPYVVKGEEDPARRAQMVEPELVDETLVFGSYRMARGRALWLEPGGGPGAEPRDELWVAKRWLLIEGRRVLFEQVPWSAVAPLLDRLPRQAATPQPSQAHRRTASLERVLPHPGGGKHARVDDRPPRDSASPLWTSGAFEADTVASAAVAAVTGPAVVLDYTLLQSQGAYALKSDTTYYVSGPVNLGGSGLKVTFEGGTVVK